ncbi:MAG: hypothetical protein R3197_14990 [Paracoccaceae bacterium]|nr:hypothetical protein [Paracoccaceae bacterium]
MTARMRRITHPGPPAATRCTALPCKAVPLRLTLRAGQSVSQAVTAGFADAGFAFGYLRLDGAIFAPLTFVTPAPAPDDSHAAWYSATYRAPAPARAISAGVHLGQRDGQPFLHCHGQWNAGADVPDGGHMLCDDSILAQDVEAEGWGLTGAGLVSRHDPETNFTLFHPEATPLPDRTNAFLVTLRPNQDLATALLDICQEHGLATARLEGIGSLVGTCFANGRIIDSPATEVLIRTGALHGGVCQLDMTSIGFDGHAQSGPLSEDAHAICVTAEILILALTE